MKERSRARLSKEVLALKWLAFALAAVAVIAFASWRLVSGPRCPTVVVYVSHVQVFSEPILKDFEKDTGASVRAVYDTEETKSTGAMNWVIAEKNNHEVLRQQGIAVPYISANSEGIPAA